MTEHPMSQDSMEFRSGYLIGIRTFRHQAGCFTVCHQNTDAVKMLAGKQRVKHSRAEVPH